MNQSEQLDQFATALAAFQKDMPSIPKNHTAEIETKSGSKYSYSYADLADAVELAAPRATAEGLSVTQMPGFVDGHDVLTTRVLHTSGQWLEDTMRLFLSKEDPQSHGSAITYARRYAYCAALGIVAEEDDDGKAASNQRRPRKQQPRREEPLPPGLIPAAVAKPRLLEAFKGDNHAFFEAWGNRGNNPVSQEELNRMIEGAPFNE